MIKKTLLAAALFSLSTASFSNTLEKNTEYFKSLDKAGQTEVLRALYFKMKEREAYQEAEKNKFVEAFAQVSNLVSQSISENQSLDFVAEGFTQEFGSNENYRHESLSLKPSVTYLMNFETKTLVSGSPYQEELKDKAVFLYFDSIRNMLLIKNPFTKVAVIEAKNVSLDEISKQAAIINPNFKY